MHFSRRRIYNKGEDALFLGEEFIIKAKMHFSRRRIYNKGEDALF